MSGEIRPIFSKEAEAQLEVIDTQIGLIYDSIKELDTIQLDFKNFKQYKKSVEDQAKATETLTKEQKKLQTATENLAFAQSEEGKELIRIREETKKVNKENREAAKDTQTAAKGYDRLRISLNKAEKEYRDLASVQGLASKETLEAQKRVQDLRAEVDAINEPIKRFSDNVGNYASAVPGFERLNGLLGGLGVNLGEVSENGEGVGKAFAQVQKGLVSATQAALRFIATPIGAALVGLSAIAVGTKAFFDFNKRIGETNVLVERLANTTGDATDKLREQATAINLAYGKEVKDSVKELSDLQKDFQITAEEAFKIYNDGLARGGAANEEFGDSIREYGQLFADAGFTAQEFIDILNTGIDLGIYNDKLPDAIKEAGLSLKEQTQSTRDALVNAFGASFTDNILREVSTGEKTIKEALLEISSEAEKAQLNQQQLAQLTADVFRGAGEDAGGALTVFNALNDSIELQTESLSDYSEAVKTSAELFNDLEEAKTRAFKSDDAIAFTQSIKNLGIEIQTSFFNAVANLREGFELLILRIRVFNSNFNITFEQLPKLIAASFNDIVTTMKSAANIIVSLGSAIKSAFSGDIVGATSIINSVKDLNIGFNQTKEVIAETQKLKEDAFKDILNQAEEQKALLLEQAKLEEDLRKEGDSNESGASGDENRFDVSDLIRSAAIENEKALIQAQQELSDLYVNGGIEAEAFIDGLAQLQKDYNALLIQDTIETLERVLLNEKLSAEEKKEVIEQLAEFRIAAQKASIDAVEEAAKQELENFKNLQKAKLEAEEKFRSDQKSIREKAAKEAEELVEQEAERIETIKKTITEAGFNAVYEIGNEFFERSQERRDLELSEFQDTQDKRVAYINELEEQGAITAEEAQLRRIRVSEQTAKKEAEIKRKQAISEKTQALFNIALNTAQAVISAIAQSPLTFGQPFAAAALVAGGIQAGIVASQPIPQFYKGTEHSPEGLAYVGERGAELIEYPDGTKQIAAKETLTWLPEGTKVKTAEETKRLLGNETLEREMKGLRGDLRRKKMSVNIDVKNNSRIEYLGL